MTDTQFYDDMDSLATELLTAFGSPATLRRITIGAVGADGKAAKTQADYPGLAVKSTHKDVMDRLNTTPEVMLIGKFPQKVTEDDLIIHASTTWKVKESVHVSPEGTRIIVSIISVVAP